MVDSEGSPLLLIFETIGITLLAFMASVLVGVAFLFPLFTIGYNIQSMVVLLGVAILGQVGFLVVAYLYIRFRDVKVPIEKPSRSDLKYLGAGTTVALITGVSFSQLLARFDLLPESVIDEFAATNPSFLLILAVLSVILIAPAEELLFRGAIQGRLRQRFSAVPAVVGASFLFGSLHLGNYTGEILPVIAAALLIVVIGSILGTVYEHTENLAVPIVVHAIYNAVLLISSYLAMM